jgi:proline iminopeptidase
MSYFDTAGRSDVLSGGVRMVPITTPSGPREVWTKRTGNNPTTKMLLLHGGPGATHEYLLAFDSFLPRAAVEYMDGLTDWLATHAAGPATEMSDGS